MVYGFDKHKLKIQRPKLQFDLDRTLLLGCRLPQQSPKPKGVQAREKLRGDMENARFKMKNLKPSCFKSTNRVEV